MINTPLFQEPMTVLAVLLIILALIFLVNQHPKLSKIYKVIPLLVFAYFIPGLLSNLGVIPIKSPIYEFIKDWLLPASLILLTLSVDIPAILRLGPKVLILFLVATLTVVIGGPLAYLLLHGFIPESMGDSVYLRLIVNKK